MQFQIPQFLDVEDKIFFGFLTLKQLGFFAGAFALAFIAYKIAGFGGAILIGILTFGGAFAISFVKINGRDLITTLRAIFGYWTKPQIYVWHPGQSKEILKERIEKVIEKSKTPQERIISLKNTFKQEALPKASSKSQAPKIKSNIKFDEPLIKGMGEKLKE